MPDASPHSNRTSSSLRHGLVMMLCLVSASALTAPPGSVFSKSPYLQAPGTNTVTLVWESLQNLPARVHFGEGRRIDQVFEVPTPRALEGVSNRSRTNHSTSAGTRVTPYTETNVFLVYEARLETLRPDTTYSYVVEMGAQTTPKRSFRTLGLGPASVRFVVYGDSRSRPEVHAAIAKRFRKFEPDFILHTGDLVARGRDYSLWSREYFDPLAGIIDHIPVFPAIGNHEEDATNYLAYFHLPPPERWYSFDLGPVHVLALDYHFERAAHPQFEFARQDLQASRAPWKIVFLHVPMFNVGGHASTWGHDTYLPLFHENQVDVVIAGHSHLYERFKPIRPIAAGPAWPIVHFTSGGGGAQLYPVADHPALASRASTNHFILFEATTNRLKGRVVLVSGKTLDRFELRKDAGRPTPDWLTQTYPEEWLRAYFEAAPLARGRLQSLPTARTPAEVTFSLRMLTNIPGPVTFDIELSPESISHYQWAGAPPHVTLPLNGEPARSVSGQLLYRGPTPATAKPGADLSPPLRFQGRLRAGRLDATTRSQPGFLTATPPQPPPQGEKPAPIGSPPPTQ